MVLAIMSTITYADGLTATLQQGENMQAFYGDSAFVKAYEAAQDGDVITLSIGDSFVGTDSITKSVTIVGAGGCTDKSDQRTNLGNLRIYANNVKIEGIYATNVTLGGISDCHIKRCFFSWMGASGTHVNTLIEQSVVKSDYAIGTGVNYTIKNSTIESFYTMNTEFNKANIENCVIWNWARYGNSTIKQPYAIYVNNILGGYKQSNDFNYTCSPQSEYYYNYFLQMYCCSFIPSFPDGCQYDGNEYGKSYLGSLFPAPFYSSYGVGIDGTVKGTYGGSGFERESCIPKITDKTIPAYADEQGKINVTISATTGPN